MFAQIPSWFYPVTCASSFSIHLFVFFWLSCAAFFNVHVLVVDLAVGDPRLLSKYVARRRVYFQKRMEGAGESGGATYSGRLRSQAKWEEKDVALSQHWDTYWRAAETFTAAGNSHFPPYFHLTALIVLRRGR